MFEKDGYHATDSNRIARAAGYAPGTFYKHFADKAEIFLAVYDVWAQREWNEIERLSRAGGDAESRIAAIVDFLVVHHRRSVGFRAALRVLIQIEPKVRRHHRAARTRQVDRLQTLRSELASPGVAGLLLLFIERVCDALADGEAKSLGIDEDIAKRSMKDRLLRGGE